MPDAGPLDDVFSTLRDVVVWVTTSGCSGWELTPIGIQRPAKFGRSCATTPAVKLSRRQQTSRYPSCAPFEAVSRAFVANV
jgi:hypothetical protein